MNQDKYSPRAFSFLYDDHTPSTSDALMKHSKMGLSTTATEPTSEHKIKKMLMVDIINKYGLLKNHGNSQRLHRHTIDVLRSLLVFGEHEYIIREMLEHDKITINK